MCLLLGAHLRMDASIHARMQDGRCSCPRMRAWSWAAVGSRPAQGWNWEACPPRRWRWVVVGWQCIDTPRGRRVPSGAPPAPRRRVPHVLSCSRVPHPWEHLEVCRQRRKVAHCPLRHLMTACSRDATMTPTAAATAAAAAAAAVLSSAIFKAFKATEPLHALCRRDETPPSSFIDSPQCCASTDCPLFTEWKAGQRNPKTTQDTLRHPKTTDLACVLGGVPTAGDGLPTSVPNQAPRCAPARIAVFVGPLSALRTGIGPGTGGLCAACVCGLWAHTRAHAPHAGRGAGVYA